MWYYKICSIISQKTYTAASKTLKEILQFTIPRNKNVDEVLDANLNKEDGSALMNID